MNVQDFFEWFFSRDEHFVFLFTALVLLVSLVAFIRWRIIENKRSKY